VAVKSHHAVLDLKYRTVAVVQLGCSKDMSLQVEIICRKLESAELKSLFSHKPVPLPPFYTSCDTEMTSA